MTQIIDAEAVENVVVAPQAAPPAYLPSKILDGAAREDALAMMARLISHTKNKTTDQAEATFQEPVENYLDEELFASEIELIFKRIPLPLALSCELPEKNNHKAIEVVGVPVVITRDSQGQVHAMLNVCRHRGALICSAGLGTSRALTCPYHAWSYGMDGQLKGLYGESTFGDFDKSERNMIKLPCVEKHGVIFVCLTPELEIDIDSWLGDFAPILESLKLADCHLFSTRMMPGPNWKVAIEGLFTKTLFSKRISVIRQLLMATVRTSALPLRCEKLRTILMTPKTRGIPQRMLEPSTGCSQVFQSLAVGVNGWPLLSHCRQPK
jgi:nitrite reductase/ring-hydroxylating ferredoxin subunit